jgi:hypothetical protein
MAVFSRTLLQVVDDEQINIRTTEVCCTVKKLFRKHIEVVPGGKVNILGSHSIGHSKREGVRVRVLFQTVPEIELFHIIVCIKEHEDALR